jgi:hypothetical protein
MLVARQIVWLQDEATARWHEDAGAVIWLEDAGEAGEAGEAGVAFAELVVAQHRANFDLWHREDEARDPVASDAQITAVKHAIDALNQRRNDLAEQMDVTLLEQAGEQPESAALHSETPGMMIDRLSILALKIFHTAEEMRRPDAEAAHRERNARRLRVLTEQRDDLARCLGELWTEVLAKRRRFKLYRQMKMYNDPELNPVVYARHHAAAEE